MVESIQAALSLLKSCFIGRHFPSDTIHIHVPCTGSVRDSPSSGLTVLLALASLLLQRACHSDAASIGEVTLRGQVLAVEGVRDVVLAAQRAGVRHLLLPLASQREVLEKVPPSALGGNLKLHYIRHAREALAWMFGEASVVDVQNETVMDNACSDTNQVALQAHRGSGKGMSQPHTGVSVMPASKL
jgi:ATP-dependent Lon protease